MPSTKPGLRKVMNTVFLLRHGRTEVPAQRSFLGRKDVPMTERGCRQMLSCAHTLKGRSIQRIFCSPLTRCLQSADIIAGVLGLPVEVESDLIEIDLGRWDGLAMDAVRRQFPTDFASRGLDLAGFRPPGGESFGDVANRVIPHFMRISRIPGEAVAIVAHAGVNRAILCHILGMPLQNLFQLGQDHGCINVIDCRGTTMRCSQLNWTGSFNRSQSGKIP